MFIIGPEFKCIKNHQKCSKKQPKNSLKNVFYRKNDKYICFLVYCLISLINYLVIYNFIFIKKKLKIENFG